jgi:hypothetical protein
MGVFTTAALTAAVGNKISAATFWNGQVRDLINGFGAHTSYTPTLTGWTLGNGTVTGRYTQVGKLVWFEAQFTFGTTSAAATAAPTFTLPATAASTAPGISIVRAIFSDTGVNAYQAIANIQTTTTVGVFILGASGLFTTPTTTTPFTWGNTDSVSVSGIYQAA